MHYRALRIILLCGGLCACRPPAPLSAQDIAAEPTEQNVALASEGAVAVADSEYAGSVYQRPGGTARQINDGLWGRPGDSRSSNRWVASISDPHPHWVWIRFRKPARISRVVLHGVDLTTHPVDFVGQFSPDGGQTVRNLFSVTGGRMNADTLVIEQSFSPVVTDNFRLYIEKSADGTHPDETELSEIEVFGEFVAAATQPSPTVKAQQPPQAILKPTTQPFRFFRTRRTEREIEFSSRWLRVVMAADRPQIIALCWDSLGEGKLDLNLLKSADGEIRRGEPGTEGGARLCSAPLFSQITPAQQTQVECEGNVVRYLIDLPDGILARWEIRAEEKSIQTAVRWVTTRDVVCRTPPALSFAFDVSRTPTAPLANPRPGLSARLPCLLHAADRGSLLAERTDRGLSSLKGRRSAAPKQWDACIIDEAARRSPDGLHVLPAGTGGWDLALSVESIALLPALVAEDTRLRALPRHWLNVFQYRDDIGILSNNIISANALTSCTLSFIEPAVFTPPLPGGVEAIHLARETLNRYFTGARGYGTEGRHPEVFLDSYPSLLIAAWDVIRVTGDLELLQEWLPPLEDYAAHIKKQDRDGNGFPEGIKPGISGPVHSPNTNWFDQINFGHEDAYSAALTYRALLRLADLERLANRLQQAKDYQADAERIRAGYRRNFFNSQTGIIAGWKDAQGKLHDYWFTFVNGAAITCGLVTGDEANAIVDRIQAKMREVGFDRFELGLPGNLVPILKSDYGVNTLGSPKQEDGSDSYGVFENGGATAAMAYFYVQALYQLGRRQEADRILWPMMQTYAAGGFQNGIEPGWEIGGEWRHWNGTPSGYEGFLADCYYTQLALMTGYYGIGFGPDGFHLEPWSPLKGRTVRLGLRYMGRIVEEIR